LIVLSQLFLIDNIAISAEEKTAPNKIQKNIIKKSDKI
jgi:hypothetical protein